jgi:hypothetical protein
VIYSLCGLHAFVILSGSEVCLILIVDHISSLLVFHGVALDSLRIYAI